MMPEERRRRAPAHNRRRDVLRSTRDRQCFISDTGKQAVQSLFPLQKLKRGCFCAAERQEENSWFKHILLKAAQRRVLLLLWSHQSDMQVSPYSTDQADNAERIEQPGTPPENPLPPLARHNCPFREIPVYGPLCRAPVWVPWAHVHLSPTHRGQF